MRRKSLVLLASAALAAGLCLVTVLSIPGVNRPDAVSSATVAPPTITNIKPNSGTIGTLVTVTGSVYGTSRGTSRVSFNGRDATAFTSWSPTEIKCQVPAGTTTGPVTVITSGGTSNAVTYTVTVLPPPPAATSPATPVWYLAEGTTDWGFDTRISIENPNNQSVTARVTYMTSTGPVQRPDITLPALSQTTLFPANDLGRKDFSTKVQCLQGLTISVDRTMTWTGPGALSPEAHSSVGVTAPAKTWYLAEGSSDWGFETWLLIQNPNATAASCQVTYMVEGASPVVVNKSVPANTRRSYNMADDIGARDASIKVTASVPIIPERAMYRNNRREGHDSIGTTTPATDYYLAEGTTNWGFTTYVLVQNPNASANTVTITYMTQNGPVAQAPFNMGPNSRKTIKVNDALPGNDLSTRVHGTQPVIAERAMYWDNGTGEACHDSIGMEAGHTTFYLPDGQSTDGYETWTLVQNPNPVGVSIEVYYLGDGALGSVVFTDTVPANSRKSFNMADKFPTGRGAILVTSTTSGRKIIVERAMYSSNRGAGTDTIGGYAD